MGKSKSLSDFGIRVTTYQGLEEYAQAFAAGHLGLLILLGPAGVGKSTYFRHALGAEACWIDGNASPLGIYMMAYAHRDQPIVLDDVDGLSKERSGVRLLKALGQTDPVKTIGWHTATPALAKAGVPREFTTSSPVAIIGNSWWSGTADVAAVEDRGHLLHFVPSAYEVHRHAAGFFWDQEIFDFVAAHLHLIQQPSLRIYTRAWELKQGGLDWRQNVLSRCLSGTTLVVAKLKADPSFHSEAQRVRAFVQAGHGARATYFNHARKILSEAPVPALVLTHTMPPGKSLAVPSLLEALESQYGHLGNG